MLYPIILHTDDNEQFGVTVPDLPGCFSQGDSIDNAVENAKEAILFHAEGLLSENQMIPIPSKVKISEFKNEIGFNSLAYAEVDMESVFGPAKRINITIRSANLQVIDIRAKARGMNRSEYLAYAGTHFDG